MGFRIDRGRMGTARDDHNGNLIVTGVLTRTGVFSYRHSDGTITRELRHPDDVFDSAAIASLVQLPITDEHPSVGKITPKNVSAYIVGNLGDTISRDGALVKADVCIRKAETIAKVKGDSGPAKRELSCGYSADVIDESGTYNGEKYDHRQTNIRGNHVAIVAAGRAGPDVRLLLDAADAEMEETAWADDLVIDDDLNLDVGGEGSRGGKVIGHTGSGKPIYEDHKHPSHENFNKQDHGEAAILQNKLAVAAKPKKKRGEDFKPFPPERLKHMVAAEHHQEMNKKDSKQDGDVPDNNPHKDAAGNIETNAGGNRVKYIKDGVVIGSGDNQFKLDKLELDIPDEAVEAAEQILDQRDLLVVELQATRNKMAEVQGKYDALEEQKKDWDNPAKQEAMAAVRQEVIATAIHAGFKADDLKGKTNAEIKREVVTKQWPDLKMDDLEEGYIQGRFDTVQDAAETENTNFQKMQDLGENTGQRNDGKPGEGEENELSYRQAAALKLDGLHLKSDEQLKKDGWA